MRARWRSPLLAASLAVGLGVSGGRAGAQAPAPTSVEVSAVQGLRFGPLLPGVPESISVTDAARRAEIILTGTGTVELAVLLPRAMTSPGGRQIPLRFGAADASILRNASTAPVPINPSGTMRLHLQGDGAPTRLLLGGTALPAPDQPAGEYTTTVVLMFVHAGT